MFSARYKREAPNSCVVVLLDEVGLAEQSPHLPLKVCQSWVFLLCVAPDRESWFLFLHLQVLHKVLDEDRSQAVVGISNWYAATRVLRLGYAFFPSFFVFFSFSVLCT